MTEQSPEQKSEGKESFLKIFIDRPVLSTVISIVIVLLGILGIVSLPISQYPNISPPTVQVTANYSGANATAVLNSVIVPLEQQINGVEGMTYISSSATNTGTANIQVFFGVGRDPDLAAVDVQNRVSAAQALLPQEVIKAGITVRKQQTSNLLIMSLYSDRPEYDQKFLQNYALINIIPQLQRINGVGGATVFGSPQTYAMRIWLQPDKMSAYGLTPADVSAALTAQNVQAAPGKFGENDNQTFQYVITYTGLLKTPEEFEKIIVKSTGNGQYLRLKDVARIELGKQTYTGSIITNGKPSVGIAISQTPGSNAREVIEKSKKVIEQAAQTFPKGVSFLYVVDINLFLDASISKVMHTLVECFLLVFLVILIFLQDLRSTIIHGISVPVAITGTFFFLYLFGFSINLLTLFALVLAIGIVVDDAIVVVEAVHAKLESGYTSPRRAAIDAMGEISAAIVSITLVMASVFLPVTFIGGSVGVFYKQFGITLAIAIILSAINALTLSPALAAVFLRPPTTEEPTGKRTLLQRFRVSFNTSYEGLTEKYIRVVRRISRRWWLVLLIVAGFGGLYWGLAKNTPSSFVPAEDMGTVYVNVSLPPASTMERVLAVNKQIDSIARRIPEVQFSMITLGQNFIAGSGASYGMVVLRLVPWDKRPHMSIEQLVDTLRRRTGGIREGAITFMPQPTITGFGNSGGFTFQLQDRAAHTPEEFYKVGQNFLSALQKRPEIQYAATSYNPNFPQYLLSVNVAKCADAGLQVTDVLSTMQVFFGSSYVSNFNRFGQQYQVILQADTAYRASVERLGTIMVRTASGAMAPITEFITLTRVFGPESVTRFNLYSSMSVSGSPNDGYSTGQALQAIRETATQTLPQGYSFEYSGISREEQSAGSQTTAIFLLCLAFVYLLLCALYESYILPLAVLLSLPVGLSGVFVFAKIFGQDNNIYMQISLIMLIGLLAKNAILMVEFSLERRREGMPLLESALEGARVRLRPILMTSLAFICGLLPLLFSGGVGARGDKAIGAGAIGGMVFGTFLGVFVIPGLYFLFQGLQERLRGKGKEPKASIQKPHVDA